MHDDDLYEEPEQEQVDELKECYRDVLSTVQGRKVLADIMKTTGVHRDVFDVDPYKSARLNGMRTVGVLLRQELMTVDPELLKKLESENCYGN